MKAPASASILLVPLNKLKSLLVIIHFFPVLLLLFAFVTSGTLAPAEAVKIY